jgi:hypothetical protein
MRTHSLARPAQKKKKEKDPDVQEKVIGFPDGKEGCELFVGEKASAYELREKGEATGEVRVVLGKITTDVATEVYEKTGYGPIDDLEWDEKAALGALLCNLAADEGVNILNKPPPPFPAGEAVNDVRPKSAEAIRIMQELDGEV